MHLAKEILPVSWRKKDGRYQPEKLLENTFLLTQNTPRILYWQ